MTHTLRIAALAAMLATPLSAYAQKPLTKDQWRADLRFLATELPKRHRNAFHKITRAQFDSAVTTLDRELNSLSDHEIVVGLASIVALIGDGHTRLALPQDPEIGFDRAHTTTDAPNDSSLYLHHLPVRFQQFEDGLYVRAATGEYKQLIGARVQRIGNMRADSALQAVRPAAHYDNEQGFLLIAQNILSVPEVLHAQGVVTNTERVTIDVAGKGSVILEPITLWSRPRFIEARELLKAIPLGERDITKPYWLEYVPATRTVYVQVNLIGSVVEENITDFARRIRRTYAEKRAARVVIDLRHNPGGDGNKARPLFTAMVRDSAINRFGHLYVLIGRETFSAAQMLVNDLESSSNALFAGEPTGGSPSSYGDSRKFKLPNSGLTVRASTIYWRDRDGNEKRAATMPDIPAPVKASDYFAGVDAAMAAVTKVDPAMAPAQLVRLVQGNAGWANAMRICWAHAADPVLNSAARAEGMAACGALLQEKKELDTAVQWFNAMIGYLPDEPAGYRGLANALRALGRTTEADAALRTAAELRR